MKPLQHFSSTGLMLILIISALPIILLQNYQENSGFMFIVISSVALFLVLLVLSLPSVYIKRRYGISFISYAEERTPSAIIFIGALYCAVAVFSAEYSLISFTEMFSKNINNKALPEVVSFLLLTVCLYAASKGINALARSSYLIFAFVAICLLVLFLGNIGNIDIGNFKLSEIGSVDFKIENFSVSIVIPMIVLAFTANSTMIYEFRKSQLAVTFLIITFAFFIFRLLIYLVLGSYAGAQNFCGYAFSKTANIGTTDGFESLYLTASTLSVIVLITILIISAVRCCGKQGSTAISSLFCIIIYVLFICSRNYKSVKEILQNPIIILSIIFIATFVIPLIYILFSRKKVV